MYYTFNVTKRQRERIPLLLINIGLDHVQEPIRRPGGFPLWQIFYCVSGIGELYLDNEKAVLNPGQIAILEPHVGHMYHSLGGGWVVHFIGFDGGACTKILSCLKLSRQGVYTLSTPGLFLSHLDTLKDLVSEAKPQPSLCSAELYSLLLDLSGVVRRLPMSQSAEESGLAKEIVLYLEDHFDKDISLDDLSAYLHKTPEYLCTSFKSITGETIMHYLRRIRIHRAKVLLMETPDTNIREIAALCGFSSASYFGRVFKESTGYTPQGYRLGVRE